MRYEFFGPKWPNADLLGALTSCVEKITIERNEGVASGSDMLLELLDISLMICLKHGCRPE